MIAANYCSRLLAVSLTLALLFVGVWPTQSDAVTSSSEVFLKGNFVEVGIHRAGSFGTSSAAPSGFHPTNGRLGFVADPDKDGWTVGTPAQTGDYFVPGSPEEGWMVEWTSGEAERQFHNFGLQWGVDIPTDSLSETSSGATRSAVWEGTASSGTEKLKVTQTVSFNADDLFFTMNVVLTNVGTSTLRSLEYMRNVDPDQEQPLTGNFITSNWVEYQPPRSGVDGRPDLAARPAGNIKKALAVAKGLNYGLTLGLGAIDSRATVAASDGFSNRDTDPILNNPVQPTSTSPSVADRAIVLVFDLGDLAPGQSTSLSYAYILNSADLEKALGNLAAVTILQPSGTVSGFSVLFQATTDDLPNTASFDFYVNGVLVGSDATPDAGGVFETAFDSYAFPNGTVALKAVAHFADGTSIEKISSASVDNTGPPISFSTPVTGQVFSPGAAIPVLLSIDAAHPPVRVSFFRESAGTGSIFLGEDTSADFESFFDVAGLPEGETVVIKAVATDAMGRVTTAVVSGVTVTNSPPVAVAGAATLVECAGVETSVVLDGSGSYDPDGDPLTFSWSGPFGTAVGVSPSVNLEKGVHAVELTVTDSKGASAVDSLTVAVSDTVPPVVDAGEDVILEATGPDGSAFTLAESVSDVCCLSSYTIDPPKTVYPLGETNVIVTAWDCEGNAASDTTTVTVVDTTPPEITAPADVVFEATGVQSVVPIGSATATDAVGEVVISSDAPPTFPVGASEVTWTATDDAGNSATAPQSVTVVDTTPPEITVPADVVFEATGAQSVVPIGSATATDAVGEVVISSDAPATFPVGTTVVTWTATDDAGNSATSTQQVTVVDTTPPVLSCPGNIEVLLNTPVSDPALLGFFAAASATDLVDGDVAVSYDAPASYGVPGATVVTFEAVDAHGNVARCTATISVRYALDGFLPPVSLQKPMKLGRTVPVKFQLADCNGLYQAGATATFTVQQFSNDEPVGEPLEVVSTSSADSGNVFRYDDTDELYIYNLDTGILQKGRYQMRVSLDDGSMLTTWLHLK